MATMSKLPKILLGVGAVLVLVVVFGVWAKHDADAQAVQFTQANAELQTSYKTDVRKLNLSKLIDIDDHGHEDAQKEYAVCNAANGLKQKLDNFEQHGLNSSMGSFLSSQYKQAKEAQHQSADARSKASNLIADYAAACTYTTKSTETTRAAEAITKSAAYRAQLSYDPSNCSNTKSGCIPASHFAAFSKVYAKLTDLYHSYKSYYLTTPCPLKDNAQQPICDLTKKLAVAVSDNSDQYLAALKQGNAAKVRSLAEFTTPHQVYDDLKAAVKKADPHAKTVDDYWRRLFAAEEQQLQQVSF